MFEPTYIAALQRLNAFIPHAGKTYASTRNYDRPGHANVSVLSPYIRHRIITEEDVLRATLARHSPSAAEKFVQEVYWRTYWKGWLEMRPSVWSQYKADVAAALNRVQTESGLSADWEAACKGETGIDCFDYWAQELVETGYLHNHARMWFASIWIFTLQLPWVLGADFFLRHLLDGDPASNTLSWRWVGGIQTMGKTYLARPDNIAKYTEARFAPKGLASHAVPLDSAPHPRPGPAPVTAPLPTSGNIGFVLTEEDMSPGWLLKDLKPTATAIYQATEKRSPLRIAPAVNAFVKDALTACESGFVSHMGPTEWTDDIVAWAKRHDLDHIVTSYAPVGPTADALHAERQALSDAGITLSQCIRKFDLTAWPHATKGFFKFKENIPALLRELQAVS